MLLGSNKLKVSRLIIKQFRKIQKNCFKEQYCLFIYFTMFTVFGKDSLSSLLLSKPCYQTEINNTITIHTLLIVVYCSHSSQVGIDIGLDAGDIRHPTSDIDISYSDIGTKNVRLNPFIPILEFNFHSDIGLNQYRIIRYLKLINYFLMTLVKQLITSVSSLVSNQRPS